MTASQVILLRHGRTASNVEGRFQGHLDVPLDAGGLQQAAHAAAHWGARLKAEAESGRVRVVSSDLSRAAQTASAVGKALGLPVELDPALRERRGGTWEGLLREEIQRRYPEEFNAWVAGEDIVIGGGESLGQCWTRTASAIQRHADQLPQGTLFVVGHGASGRGGVLQLCGLVGVPTEPDDLLRYQAIGGLGNCHWAELSRRQHRWLLSRWNVSVA